MEQKVIFNGQVFTLTRFWATEEPCLRITDPQQIEMPKMELVGAPRRILHLPEKSDGNRVGTDHIPGRRSAGCERRTSTVSNRKGQPYGTTR